MKKQNICVICGKLLNSKVELERKLCAKCDKETDKIANKISLQVLKELKKDSKQKENKNPSLDNSVTILVKKGDKVEYSFEGLKNVRISQYSTLPNPTERQNHIFDIKPKPPEFRGRITILTSQMPEELGFQIESLIKAYCNH